MPALHHTGTPALSMNQGDIGGIADPWAGADREASGMTVRTTRASSAVWAERIGMMYGSTR